ncbi:MULTISPECIES: hypothetical protein [Azospirillum]|uniref:hypothetical protein n=1 Tax=Azospirillum sp. INR13 TaxID=2596919 RepID=UPI001892142F|nr:hypothetical protein [Azospirillum sp. INR13]MBF5093838.1 hypothetical protein [Azospirillum sp. INR13]MBK3777627.1 hypothetical protein [Azospirillum brasilense]
MRRHFEAISPILEQILYGGSSVSLNLLSITQSLPEEAHLFRTHALNHVILFKYPNFDESQGDGHDFLNCDAGNALSKRPVETGIYIPHDGRQWETGGVAIYLRSRNSTVLLEEHFGPEAVEQESVHNDLSLLSLIDNIPSLDAFLLKTYFEAKKIRLDQRYWQIAAEEEAQLRRLISRRVEPIVRKAVNDGIGSEAIVGRFLDAIWNPDMEEAGHFVSAFGIDHSEADAIFSAWKGITFYEYQLRRIAPRVRTIITWLRSRECVPADLKMHRPYDEHLLMHIDRVGHMLNATLLDIRHILGEYEKSFKALMNGSPSLFREFLRTIHAHYWLLGYCVSALISVVHLDNRCMKNLPSRHVDFETLSRLLRQFDVALDRRREQKSAF